MAKVKLNFEFQYYKEIKIQLIRRGYAKDSKAKRFAIGGTNQNVWIPNKHLELDGTIKEGENIDYVFRKAQRQLELAGYLGPIIGIKRRSEPGAGVPKESGDVPRKENTRFIW